MTDGVKIVTELTNAFGPSGFEAEVRNVFAKWVSEYAEISYDHLGSIVAMHRGRSESPRVLLAGHMDEVGLLVRGILPSGYLKVVPLGSWWPMTLLAQKVVVKSGTGNHFGVIGAKPPHFLTEEEKSRPLKLTDLYVDIGTRSREETETLGIKPGDPIAPAVVTEELSPSTTLVGKAFDDRAGCAAIIQVLRELTADHPNLVLGAGTVQEENGLKGARTVANLTRPDVAIVLEGTPADDFPDSGSIIQGKLGGGPQIRWLDPSMIANRSFIHLAEQEAKKLGIAYQMAVREGGGTDAHEIQMNEVGVPTIVIGVPVRYAHSPHSIIHTGDLDATVKLVKAIVNVLDEAAVKRLKEDPWK